MVTINLSATGAKEAAARLREFLAADGVGLKQTHAYEALARTLGYANWNTLQALLNAAPLSESEPSPAAATPADTQAERTDEELAAEQRPVEKGRIPILSRNLEQSLHRAISLASERHHEYATLEHLLLSLTEDQDAASVFLACNMDIEQLRKELTEYINSKLDQLVTTAPGAPKPTTGFQRAVQRAVLHIQNSGRDETNSGDVVVSLFTERESSAVDFLQRQGMTRLDAVNYIVHGLAKPLGGGQSG